MSEALMAIICHGEKKIILNYNISVRFICKRTGIDSSENYFSKMIKMRNS